MHFETDAHAHGSGEFEAMHLVELAGWLGGWVVGSLTEASMRMVYYEGLRFPPSELLAEP